MDNERRTVKVLTGLLESATFDFNIEADTSWFPKDGFKSPEEGEAQAVIEKDGKRYCVSLEPLP